MQTETRQALSAGSGSDNGSGRTLVNTILCPAPVKLRPTAPGAATDPVKMIQSWTCLVCASRVFGAIARRSLARLDREREKDNAKQRREQR
jgi:hypothetical protein